MESLVVWLPEALVQVLMTVELVLVLKIGELVWETAGLVWETAGLVLEIVGLVLQTAGLVLVTEILEQL